MLLLGGFTTSIGENAAFPLQPEINRQAKQAWSAHFLSVFQIQGCSAWQNRNLSILHNRIENVKHILLHFHNEFLVQRYCILMKIVVKFNYSFT